jgi:hypothetical protein
MTLCNVYNSMWYLQAVAPTFRRYSQGGNEFAYVLNSRGEAASPYGYPGITGDPAVIRAAIGLPLFIRHRVSHQPLELGPNVHPHPTRVIPMVNPWTPEMAKAIARARRMGIMAEYHGAKREALRDFRDGYRRAMLAKVASAKYMILADNLEEWADLPWVHVFMAGGCGVLFLAGGDGWAHYHLSYCLADHHNAAMDAIFGAAVPLLVDCMGVEQIHLGGGMSTKPDDSLFRFKSRVGRVPWTVFFEEVP